MKAYRLLRNNKEIGPYSAEELKGMGLKAYDLIWVDGKSASWRYPGEIEELQSFAPPVEEQPFDRFFKPKNDAKKSAKEEKPAVVVTEAPQAKTEKPRIRVKAEWSVAKEEPAAIATKQKEEIKEKTENIFAKREVPAVDKETNNLGWQEAFADWKKDEPEVTKKVVKPTVEKAEPARKDKNYVYEAEMLEENPADAALNTYYKKRNELNTSLNGQVKKSSAKYINYITPILFIIAIGAFAVYMNKKNDNNTIAKDAGQPVKTATVNNTATKNAVVNDEQQSPAALPVDANIQKEGTISTPSDLNQKSPVAASSLNTNEKTLNNKATNSTNSKPVAAKPPVTAKVGDDQPLKKVSAAITNTVANNTTAINKIQHQADKANDIVKNNVPPAENKTVKNQTPVNPGDNTSTAKPDVKTAENLPAEETKTPATIGSYVQMQTVTQEEGNKRLQVRNISDYKLDLVVVDIQYYDANNKFTKGESIYLHNIPSGKNMLVKTPDDKMASRITAKVSLVSSDEKGIYLVGE